MKRTWILAAFVVACLLAPSSRGDYLGKSSVSWQNELKNAKTAQAKRSAAFALGKCGGQARAALPDLIKCLKSDSEDAGVRETAAYSIGQIIPRGTGTDDLLALLCKLAGLRNDDDRITRSVVIALGKCGTDKDEVRAALERALESPSPAVRQNAVWALGEVCQKTDTVPVSSLRKALASNETDNRVKRDAALALGKMVASGHIGGIEASADQKRSAQARQQAKVLIADLLEAVGNDYVELKKAACGTLVDLVDNTDTAAVAVLAKACAKTEDVEVRRNAALALAAIGGQGAEAAVPVLQEILRSPDPEQRKKALLAFRKLGPVSSAALPDLLNVLSNDPDESVRNFTAAALGGWKNEPERSQVVPILVQCVANSNEKTEVRVAASRALQDIGKCPEATAAIETLHGVLKNTKEPARVRERVLWALRVHGRELADNDGIMATLEDVMAEPGLKDPGSGGKMLRYDAAFLLSIFKQSKVTEKVFPVLLEFLKDDTIRIFTGLATSGGRFTEGGSGKSNLAEQGAQDGRANAVQALEEIGKQGGSRSQAGINRVTKGHAEIVTQLKKLSEGDGATFDPTLREKIKTLLKEWKVRPDSR